MDTITTQLQLLDTQWATRLIPLALAAIFSYVVVNLFYYYGPLQSLRNQSALKKQDSRYGDGDDETLEDFVLRPNAVRR